MAFGSRKGWRKGERSRNPKRARVAEPCEDEGTEEEPETSPLTSASEFDLDDFCSKVYVGMVAYGVLSDPAFCILADAGYEKSVRTLQRRAEFRCAATVPNAIVNRGRFEATLNPDQTGKVHSWALVQNDLSKDFGLEDIQRFILDEFHASVSESFASRLLQKLNLTRKKCTTKSPAVKISSDEQVRQMMDFNHQMKRENAWTIPKAMIFSMDATSTQQGRHRPSTFSPCGGVQPRSNTMVPRHTNSIVTCLGAAGGNGTYSIVYTHNPAMNENHSWANKRARLIEASRKFGIDLKRVVYIPAIQGKCYCAESSQIYSHYIEHHLALGTLPKGALVMHDAGNAYKEGSTSIFSKYPLNEACYPSAVHHQLSPNDHDHHGVKGQWRKEFPFLVDDLERTFRLMQLLDIDACNNSKYYFQRNLFELTPTIARMMVV
jgi:hypothetical protein